MKKTIVLLFAFYFHHFAFSQNNSDKTISTRISSDAVFAKLDHTNFTQAERKGIISSYARLGERQRALGQLEEASFFYEKAYALAKNYFLDFSREEDAQEKYAEMNDLAGAFYLNSKKDKVNALVYFQKAEELWTKLSNDYPQEKTYQEKADLSHGHLLASQKETLEKDFALANTNTGSSFISSTNTEDDNFVNTSPSRIEAPSKEMITAWFMAITEPADYGVFTLRQKTSLRQEATHKSKVLRRLKADMELVVLEKTYKHWWKVSVKGEVGYVKSLLLE